MTTIAFIGPLQILLMVSMLGIPAIVAEFFFLRSKKGKEYDTET